MSGPFKLSARELECLTLAAEGKSDTTIGKELGLSANTVGECMEQAKVKLKAGTRIEAIVLAVRTGLIRL